jgi:hypothetical protein
MRQPFVGLRITLNVLVKKGAIGFDWVTAGAGGVPWLISRPRKKLIKRHLPKRMCQWLPNLG